MATYVTMFSEGDFDYFTTTILKADHGRLLTENNRDILTRIYKGQNKLRAFKVIEAYLLDSRTTTEDIRNFNQLIRIPLWKFYYPPLRAILDLLKWIANDLFGTDGAVMAPYLRHNFSEILSSTTPKGINQATENMLAGIDSLGISADNKTALAHYLGDELKEKFQNGNFGGRRRTRRRRRRWTRGGRPSSPTWTASR